MDINYGMLVYYIFFFMGIGMSLVKSGTKKTGKHSFGIDLFSYAISLTIILWINGWNFL